MSIFAIAMRQLFITLLICVVSAIGADAQIVDLGQEKINTDSLRRELDNGPYFTLYKDNYFITGTSIGPQTPSRTNSDVKFQVSIAQRLTKSTLPFNTYLFLCPKSDSFVIISQGAIGARQIIQIQRIIWMLFSKNALSGI